MTETEQAVQYLASIGWRAEIAEQVVGVARRMRGHGHSHRAIAEKITAESGTISPGAVRVVCGD